MQSFASQERRVKIYPAYWTLSRPGLKEESTLLRKLAMLLLSLTSGPSACIRSCQDGCLLAGSHLATRSCGLQWRTSRHRCNMESPSDGSASLDWRAFRARLVQRERSGDTNGILIDNDVGGNVDNFLYESPILEQGSLIIGEEFGCALDQQYMHKCVILILQHDSKGTKGIILNRPASYEIEGWRVWFGGNLDEGGMFGGDDEDTEITCLHALTGEMADRLSRSVLKGMSYTTRSGARQLISAGLAKQSDFLYFVGHVGWYAQQLQNEVDEGYWFLASAGSATLWQELSKQEERMQNMSASAAHSDGLATWENIMTNIGRSDEVRRSSNSYQDRMMKYWCRVHLVWNPAVQIIAPKASEKLRVGSVLFAGSPSDRAILQEQFLHKSVLLIVHQLDHGTILATVLNRPTPTILQMEENGTDLKSRCIGFGGEDNLEDDTGLFDLLGIGGDECLWIGQSATLDGMSLGTPVGDSGLRRVSAQEAIAAVDAGTAKLSDFLLVSGFVSFASGEIAYMLQRKEFYVLEDPKRLWPHVWNLVTNATLDLDSVTNSSEGTDVWKAAVAMMRESSSHLDVMNASHQADSSFELADDALEEWLSLKYEGNSSENSTGQIR